MARKPRRAQGEPTIPLINVVFLMLIFFLVAGQIAPPLAADLSLVRTAELEGRAPPDTLIIRADGEMQYRGEPVASAAAFADTLPEDEREEIRLVPDRDLEARALVNIAAELRGAGAGRVLIVTERGLAE
ncbi:ExbD/TolR family protein [Palleronia sp.]|uniref:ExbD/TolR family protein n=1 Tax=Palleronia sp. TaxID=1940284 RepID=UPI0035C7968C